MSQVVPTASGDDPDRDAAHDDAAERRRAAALAGHTGAEAEARQALTDPDGGVRATALAALERMGALRADELHDTAQDPHGIVRRRVAELIGRRGGLDDGEAQDARSDPRDEDRELLDGALANLLDDRGAAVVEMAAWAAGERWAIDTEGEPVGAPPDVMARLIAVATDHDDPLAREAAVAALGAIGDPAGEAAVLAAMHGTAVLRRRAVLALAAFDGTEAHAALRRALTDRDWQVRQAAEDLLDERPGPDAAI